MWILAVNEVDSDEMELDVRKYNSQTDNLKIK